MLTLDVIIPCYNASATLERAVQSVINQKSVQKIYLVDDGSTDDTWQKITQFEQQFSQKIKGLQLAKNSGVAMARNFGVLHSDADLVAFLDADDAYQNHALDPVPSVFEFLPNLSLLRLKLVAHGLPQKFSNHEKFATAWDRVQMTVGGNTIFRRALFLMCGGFPTDDLFRRLGGEDGALGIALAERTMVGTLFEATHQGVVHYCREGMHAERLLNAYLFNIQPSDISEQDIAYANGVTKKIIQQIDSLMPIVNEQTAGRRPIFIEYE